MADESKQTPQSDSGVHGKSQSDDDGYRQTHSKDPGLTPGSAEGEEETVDEALRRQEEKKPK